VRAAALAALLALTACGSGASTGIVVEVTSDLAVPEDQPFHLRVSTADGRQLRDLLFHLTDLPARFELTPERATATTVTVEASAPVGTPPLSRRATVAFRPGALLLLSLPLNAACVCTSCGAGQTCVAERQCEDVVKDAATLPAYAPRAAGESPRVAVPVCSGEAGSPSPDGGDGAPAFTADARVDSPVAPEVGSAGSDAGAPDTRAPASDVPAPSDLATPPDASAVTPDAAVTPPDTASPAPDLALPRDSGPPPDLPPLRADGQPCATSDQCLSGACIDHVCCHTACVGPCLACDNPHTGAPSGQCAPVLAGTDPDDDCAPDGPMTCGYDGLCNGAGACRFYPATTQCAAPTCNAASSFTPARNCTGAGACAAPAPKDCGLFLCAPSGCPATCQSHAACASNAYCDGNVCQPQKPALAPCMENRECRNGCSLGLCL
jgi:hypothetical protein